jgi:glycosyltransferase involved in cell wall biosynthesis
MRDITVGIDGYNLGLPNGTGVASYACTLASTVAALGHGTFGLFGIDSGTDRALSEILFYERLANPPSPPRRSMWRRIVNALPVRLPAIIDLPKTGAIETRAFDERLPHFDRIATGADLFRKADRHFRKTGRFASLMIRNPPEVMHWTYPIPLRLVGARNIYTIHDLVPLRLPYATLDNKPHYHALIDSCIRSSDKICTVSQASADDILALFPHALGRVVNTYQASEIGDIAIPGAHPEGSRAVVEALGLRSDGYFLFYGAIEPKKNVARLVEAYLRLNTATPLVIVSGRSWRNEAEASLLSALNGLEGRIVQLDYVSKTVLADLIRHARAVTFPSLSEGFGLPVHEAMLLGTPVLTSDLGALREIAGDAAILIDPYVVASITAGLRLLDGSAEVRRRMSEQGRAQAKLFSPERYRSALSALYASVMEKY